ncbi:hypothetical protein BH24ACT3_BH24ACT3_10140 [soil metagenome]
MSSLAGPAWQPLGRPMKGTKMDAVMIRYRVKREQVERHLELLRAAYEELERTRPGGLRWTTFQLDDGVSFVDVSGGEAGPEVLQRVEAFQEFRSTLDERCDEPPVMTFLDQVASYRSQ